jgi:plastocyanin
MMLLSDGHMATWGLRFVLALGAVALALLALGGRPSQLSGAEPEAATATPAPTTAARSVPVPVATATSEPFVERITSRLARETAAPYPTATPFADGSAHVSAVDFGYMPSVIRVRAGQTVVWRNDGREEHDVVGDDWHSGQMEPTIEYRLTFGTVGRFDYRCSIHPDMTGTVIVGP